MPSNDPYSERALRPRITRNTQGPMTVTISILPPIYSPCLMTVQQTHILKMYSKANSQWIEPNSSMDADLWRMTFLKYSLDVAGSLRKGRGLWKHTKMNLQEYVSRILQKTDSPKAINMMMYPNILKPRLILANILGSVVWCIWPTAVSRYRRGTPKNTMTTKYGIRKAPPPCLQTRLGNLQKLPYPTANPMADRRQVKQSSKCSLQFFQTIGYMRTQECSIRGCSMMLDRWFLYGIPFSNQQVEPIYLPYTKTISKLNSTYQLTNIRAMNTSALDSFPGGNLTYSLRIDEDKLNQRFSWILSMFRMFDNRMKSYEDRISLIDFESTNNPLEYQRAFEKMSREALDQIHQQRKKVYFELFNSLEKTMSQKFSASFLLELEKRLEETRVLFLGNISSSSKSIDRLSGELSRAKLRIVQISANLQRQQEKLRTGTQEVHVQQEQKSVQTTQQTPKEPTKPILIRESVVINQLISQKIDERVQELAQRLEFNSHLLNKRCENILLLICDQQTKLKEYIQTQFQCEEGQEIVINRSASPSIRKTQRLDQTTTAEIDRLKSQIKDIKQSLYDQSRDSQSKTRQWERKIQHLQNAQRRSLLDSSEERLLKERISNHLTSMFQKPFEQKFGKGLSDELHFKLANMKHELTSYRNQIDRRVEERASCNQLRNMEITWQQRLGKLEHSMSKKADSVQVESTIRKFRETREESFHKTELIRDSRQICLSCRQPKAQLVFRRSSSKKLPLRKNNQTISYESTGKKIIF